MNYLARYDSSGAVQWEKRGTGVSRGVRLEIPECERHGGYPAWSDSVDALKRGVRPWLMPRHRAGRVALGLALAESSGRRCQKAPRQATRQ